MTIHDYYMCYYGNFKNSEQIYFLRSLKTDSGKTCHDQFQKKYNLSQITVVLVSFHLKWNRTISLSLQTDCTSYLKSCQTT